MTFESNVMNNRRVDRNKIKGVRQINGQTVNRFSDPSDQNVKNALNTEPILMCNE